MDTKVNQMAACDRTFSSSGRDKIARDRDR